MKLTSLLLLTALGTAQAAVLPASGNPARLNGLWTLTGGRQVAPGRTLPVGRLAGQLRIVNGRVSGQYGCGRFQGTLRARQNALLIHANLLPPRPTERCPLAAQNPVVTDLNAARQYTVSPQHLVLFSKSSRLVFERAGSVTPAKK